MDEQKKQEREIKDQKKQEYAEYVKKVTPKNNLALQMAKAFLVGGIICVVGQIILNVAKQEFGLDKDTAGSWCAMLLVLASALLTGFNLYQKLVKFGGAGALVPITGFANSVSSAAIEYQKEGQVYGIGCKIFTIAGPVILYGIFTSWVLGVLYWIGKMLGIC
ncbi:MAG: SpoVA/SpoVAEb family sporulation membrane protein [Lachnospiraceae bacterium]|nr:SpoVA/SpoVAEb family sporulation membrane protein [Lachnospiraceae bacterium]